MKSSCILWIAVSLAVGSGTPCFAQVKFPDGSQQTTAYKGALAAGSYAVINGGIAHTASGAYATVGGGELNTAGDYYATVGGGTENAANGQGSTIGGGYYNGASGAAGTIGGGVSNTAGGSRSTVGGGSGNSASGSKSTVGGGERNQAAANYATIAGGGPSNSEAPVGNRVTDDYGSIGGGADNQAGDDAGTTLDAACATVSGGINNVAGGGSATVGGGGNNLATASITTVGGGASNEASDFGATIGGGQYNQAGAVFSTVPGGLKNAANGPLSFAAGRRAKVSSGHGGSFLWADMIDADFNSTAANQFAARASGGVTFYTNGALSTGVAVPAGGGSWSSVSTREAKENFELVDTREVLEKVVAMPIQTWNYKAQDESKRHIGPTAEDFLGAFDVGDYPDRITSIDADGVALAAIQGLHQALAEKDEAIRSLEALSQTQAQAIRDLTKRIEAMESN